MPTKFDFILEKGPTRRESLFATTDTGACWDFHYGGAYSYSYNKKDGIISSSYVTGVSRERVFYDANRIINLSVVTRISSLAEESEEQ